MMEGITPEERKLMIEALDTRKFNKWRLYTADEIKTRLNLPPDWVEESPGDWQNGPDPDDPDGPK